MHISVACLNVNQRFKEHRQQIEVPAIKQKLGNTAQFKFIDLLKDAIKRDTCVFLK